MQNPYNWSKSMKTLTVLLILVPLVRLSTSTRETILAEPMRSYEDGDTHLSMIADPQPTPHPPIPYIGHAARHDTSPPLIDIHPIQSEPKHRELPLFSLPRRSMREHAAPAASIPGWPTQVTNPSSTLEAKPATFGSMPAPLQNFEGVSNVNRVMPPDPQGDVGPSHYVQWVNLSFAIWEKGNAGHQAQGTVYSPTLVYGPADGNTLWTGFGGPCETTNNGDPITLYDSLADRWFMSQLALPNFPYGPFYQCIAVSKTGDPTGAWYRYEFLMPVNKINDYPKFGVWPDGYYMSVNQYEGGTLRWGGAGVAVFERDKLLTGKVARMIYLDIGATDLSYSGLLPADFDGTTLPPVHAPNYFAAWDDSAWSREPHDSLRLWAFHVDWDTPANTTFGLTGYTPNFQLSTDDVDPDMCGQSRDCIPQPDTQQRLDAISDRLMYRLQYRNFGAHETLLTNHTIDVDSTDHAGIHWIELRKDEDAWTIHQEGVYAPDSDHRWMGSIAMDRLGNIALGYSVASTHTFPSIRYNGRLAGDPLGIMGQGEVSLIEGTASQTESNRWGDYSMMAVDPADDCTFWYTQEYYRAPPSQTIATPTGRDWRTRIGAFKFPNCTTTSPGLLTGVIYESTGSPATHPIAGASIQVNLNPTQTLNTSSDPNGHYEIALPPGAYTMTVMAYGYQANTITDVVMLTDTRTTMNIRLKSLGQHIVSGNVTDAETGWPLYAHVIVRGTPLDPPPPYNEVWTDPATGSYNVTLAAGTPHTLETYAWTAGYLPAHVTLDPLTKDQTQQAIALQANPKLCTAPGHSPSYRHLDDFERTDGGYTHAGMHDEWQWGTPTTWPEECASGTRRCWGTNLNGDYASNADQSLYSPRIDLSEIPSGTIISVSWWQAWTIEDARDDQAFVEISLNEGQWTKIWEHESTETIRVDWKQFRHDISEAAGGSVQLRWRLLSDSYLTYEGLYVDHVLVKAGCVPQEGGLVIGNVYDENTGYPLAGASVMNNRGHTALALATPQDAHIEDAFYTIFAPEGPGALTATLRAYGPQALPLTTPRQDITWLDFHLPAGYLTYTPSGLAITMPISATRQLSLTLANEGGHVANFKLQEANQGVAPVHLSRQPILYERVTVPYEDPFLLAPTTTLQTRAPAQWGQGAPIPTGGRYRAGGVSCDGETYYVFGGSDGYDVLNEAWQYNPADDFWRALAPMPIALMNFDATCIDNYIYLVGGYDGRRLTNDFQIYDVANDSWSVTTWPRPWPPMTTAWQGKLYAFGGSGPHDETWRYDPATGHWGMLAPMPTPNAYGTALTINNYIYQIGGGFNNIVQRYDPVNNQWDNSGPQLQDNRMSPLAVWYGDDIYVISGGGAGGGIWSAWETVEVYNPAHWPQGQWAYDDERIGIPGVAIAGDCVADVIWGAGGSDGYTVYDTNQYLDDNKICHIKQPVSWLSETPITGTLSAQVQQDIRFTFDTRVPEIQQPGHYYASVKVNTDTPYKVMPIPITMTVTPPATWGKVMGTVTSLGYCDTAPAPLKGASVSVTSASGISWTLETDANGMYQLWLDKAYSPLTITLTHPEHATSVFTNVVFGTRNPPVVTRDVTWRLQSPCVKASPAHIDVKVAPGDIVQAPLTLSNMGAMSTPFKLHEMNSSRTNFSSLNRALSSGGPDAFGYTYKDSDEIDGPIYQWIDISAMGNAIFLEDDEGAGPFGIGFPFRFYGNKYTTFYISSNGYLSFNNTNLLEYNNQCPLPDSSDPNDSIYVMWDDLNPDWVDAVYYETFFDCPYGGGLACLVVQYEDFHGYDGSTAGTFEAILFENGNILMQFADAGHKNGASSTTGIENVDGSDGLTYLSCNTPGSLDDNLALCFARPGQPRNCMPDIPWLSVAPDRGRLQARTSIPQPPQATTVYVTVKALPSVGIGNYDAALNIQSGDLISPQQSIPVNVHISDQWRTYIYVNGERVTSRAVTVIRGDSVTIADHVRSGHPVHNDNMTFTLTHTWTPFLTLATYEVSAHPGGTSVLPGSDVSLDTGALTWNVTNLPSDWTYVLTKTFKITATLWAWRASGRASSGQRSSAYPQGYMTGTLQTYEDDIPWLPRILTFRYPTLYLPITFKNFSPPSP